jgi:hypothetical protein
MKKKKVVAEIATIASEVDCGKYDVMSILKAIASDLDILDDCDDYCREHGIDMRW